MLLLLHQPSHCIFKGDMPSHLGTPVVALSLYLICYTYWRVGCRSLYWSDGQRGVDALSAETWKEVRTTSDSCRQTKMSFHISDPTDLFMNIHPSASYCPNHRVNPFKTAQLSVQRVNDRGSWVITAKRLWVQTSGCWSLLLFPPGWCQGWAEEWLQFMWVYCAD